MRYDVVIVGGGPAGLSAALTLGRARKRVLLCDAGARRNQAASHLHGFVTRDGTPPQEFRRLGRAQLAAYPGVELRDAPITAVRGERGQFTVHVGDAAGGEAVQARRLLLSAGLIDELPDLEGFAAAWGRSIFQCPYCHGWEAQDQPMAYLASGVEALPFALLLRGWSRDVAVLTDGKFAMPAEASAQLTAAGVALEQRPIARLRHRDGQLEAVEFADGAALPRRVLFAHVRQRQVALVGQLGLALTDAGFVQLDELRRETSVPGVYAGGDLIGPAQTATLAASAGMMAAAMLNHELTAELALSGQLE